ncbi:hypothetical protein F3Y22_tig00005974pilonHSYRG00067 [Hibiscus syriacus]|uniref:Uncharacterized protein n=1 Tax=Hibiscus syriacus TaxID=106335 RepID=A0A6A3CI83_HIBSY|nr:hypothetical protein F3Y22_tig00005974pilonHSYRG00067 [Hibiscus syriacus]
MTSFMRSNRAVSKADIDEATTLKEVGVGTSQVMNYLTQHAGGYHNVGFTHKDLYNALQREVLQMARFAALRSTSSRLCYIASKTDESFKIARDEIKRLIEELENSFGLNDLVNQSIVVNNVRDPQRKQCKRKEVPKNKVEKIIRRCGYCNGDGHNKLTCSQVKLSLSIM